MRVIVGFSPRAAGGTSASFGFRRDIPQIIFFPSLRRARLVYTGCFGVYGCAGSFLFFLYATTREFLDYFNLSSLEDLPSLGELADLDQLNPELNLGEPPKDAEAQSPGSGVAEGGGEPSASDEDANVPEQQSFDDSVADEDNPQDPLFAEDVLEHDAIADAAPVGAASIDYEPSTADNSPTDDGEDLSDIDAGTEIDSGAIGESSAAITKPGVSTEEPLAEAEAGELDAAHDGSSIDHSSDDDNVIDDDPEQDVDDQTLAQESASADQSALVYHNVADQQLDATVPNSLEEQSAEPDDDELIEAQRNVPDSVSADLEPEPEEIDPEDAQTESDTDESVGQSTDEPDGEKASSDQDESKPPIKPAPSLFDRN